MSLTLYYSPGACSGVTINAIKELGLACEFVRIGLSTGEHKTERYLKINPHGKVPALLAHGRLLTENPAILIYLNSLVAGSKLIPETDDAFERSVYYSDLMWLSSTVHPSVRHISVPAYYTVAEDTTDVITRGKTALTVHLQAIEQRLTVTDWWYGDHWAIMDTYLHWCYSRAQRSGFSLNNYPAILAHKERIEIMPSYKSRVEVEAG
jgi:glutathione S-transferase